MNVHFISIDRMTGNCLLKISNELSIDVSVALASDVALVAHFAVSQALGTGNAGHDISF